MQCLLLMVKEVLAIILKQQHLELDTVISLHASIDWVFRNTLVMHRTWYWVMRVAICGSWEGVC